MVSRAGMVIFWLAVACCVVAQVAIVRGAARAGRVSGQGEDRALRRSELAWTLVPAAMLAAVLLFTWRAMWQRS